MREGGASSSRLSAAAAKEKWSAAAQPKKSAMKKRRTAKGGASIAAEQVGESGFYKDVEMAVADEPSVRSRTTDATIDITHFFTETYLVKGVKHKKCKECLCVPRRL